MAQAKKRAIEAGKKAPRFKLENQDGEWFQAKDLDGRAYVLYFYPKANTSG